MTYLFVGFEELLMRFRIIMKDAIISTRLILATLPQSYHSVHDFPKTGLKLKNSGLLNCSRRLEGCNNLQLCSSE